MKNKEELNALEDLNNKFHELTDKDIALVNGGTDEDDLHLANFNYWMESLEYTESILRSMIHNGDTEQRSYMCRQLDDLLNKPSSYWDQFHLTPDERSIIISRIASIRRLN